MASSGVPRIALIIGSTRPNRFADVPAKWLFDAASQRHDMTIETLDLRDWPLAFFEEPASPSVTGGVFNNPVAERWGGEVARRLSVSRAVESGDARPSRVVGERAQGRALGKDGNRINRSIGNWLLEEWTDGNRN
jgi:hypothetical protein